MKSDGVGRSKKIFVDELEQEEILVEVEHSDDELYNPNEVEEETQVANEYEVTDNDYLLARDRLKRVINPPQRLDYVDLIAFVLISASEILDEEPKDYK